MVSTNLRKCIPLLQTLSAIKDPRKKEELLRLFESNLHRAFREMSYNLLRGNVTLSAEDKKRLKRYKKIIRVLAEGKARKKGFRKLVVQTGRGFLPALIPLIVSTIASAL